MTQATRTGGTLPRAVKWGLLTWGGDMAVCVPAFSAHKPQAAAIVVTDRPPAVQGARASRLALVVKAADGATRRLILEEMSAQAERTVMAAPTGTVVVVEEEAAAPNGRRHAYVAQVRGARPAPEANPTGGLRR